MPPPPRANRTTVANKNRLQPPAAGSGCRRSVRLQSKPPISYAQTTHRSCTKQKHFVEPETEPQKPPPSTHSLTEENLRIFNEEETTTTTKRTRTESNQESSTNGSYRIHRLKVVNVFFDDEIPDNFQAAVDKIVKAKIPSEERRTILRHIAERFYDFSQEISRARSGEGNFIILCHEAIRDMSEQNIFRWTEGNWRCEFKPGISKGSPIFRDDQGAPAIKTPCPDITIGINGKAFLNSLSSQDLDKTQAKEFLRRLETDYSLNGGEEKLLLTVMDTDSFFFPFATLEGKAYLTGRQISEAQNQAAVSGACALNLQLHLTEMAKLAAPEEFDASLYQYPLFFSICTEGPYHELWAHYTCIEGSRRVFNMKLVKICNAMLKESIENFIIAVDNVLRWGADTFLKSVTERMRLVAIKTLAEVDEGEGKSVTERIQCLGRASPG